MKTRIGFVSNSSSSSFVCKACHCDFVGDRGYFPFMCNDCIEFIMPDTVMLKLTKEELLKINQYNSVHDNTLLEKIADEARKIVNNED